MTKRRIAVAVVASITLIALWMTSDMPIAILPALMVAIWIPIFSRQPKTVSLRSKRFTLAFVALGILMVLVQATIYFLQS
jgi:hypothetical protein